MLDLPRVILEKWCHVRQTRSFDVREVCCGGYQLDQCYIVAKRELVKCGVQSYFIYRGFRAGSIILNRSSQLRDEHRRFISIKYRETFVIAFVILIKGEKGGKRPFLHIFL